MALTKTIKNLINPLDTKTIPNTLQPLVDYTQQKINNQQTIRLCFICTHNSKRSHLAQIWAQTMSYYFGLKNINYYSAGTETTGLHPMIIQTLLNMGLLTEQLSDTKNPIYSIKYSKNEPAIVGFSKDLNSTFNPKTEFCAIMICSEADTSCPFISGAEKRIPITFNDLKIFDNTPQQTKIYYERNLQIAVEMFYVFSKIETPIKI